MIASDCIKNLLLNINEYGEKIISKEKQLQILKKLSLNVFKY